jgi:hypothetical protein
MATYLDMQERIADDYVNESITSAQIKNAIQGAIRHYERRPFYFNQKINASFNTVSGQEYYGAAALSDIPAIVEIRSATVSVSGSKSNLTGVDFGEIGDAQTGSQTGIPYAYSYFSQQIRLYPIPSAAYPITLSYIYKLAALSADADENAWTNDAEELIRQAAKIRIALDTLQSPDLASNAESLRKVAFDELLAENRRRMSKKLLTTNLPSSSSSLDVRSGA